MSSDCSFGRERRHAARFVFIERGEDLSVGGAEVGMAHVAALRRRLACRARCGEIVVAVTSVVEFVTALFFRAITTSSLPPSAVLPTVIPSAEKPSRQSSFSSFCSVDVLRRCDQPVDVLRFRSRGALDDRHHFLAAKRALEHGLADVVIAASAASDISLCMVLVFGGEQLVAVFPAVVPPFCINTTTSLPPAVSPPITDTNL